MPVQIDPRRPGLLVLQRPVSESRRMGAALQQEQRDGVVSSRGERHRAEAQGNCTLSANNPINSSLSIVHSGDSLS